jgi:hypothetical protein
VNLRDLRARLDKLAALAPSRPSELRGVVFEIMDPGPTGPIHTGTLVHVGDTWREVPPPENAL